MNQTKMFKWCREFNESRTNVHGNQSMEKDISFGLKSSVAVLKENYRGFSSNSKNSLKCL